MLEQERKVVSLERHRELECSCRLWIAACEARDLRIKELEQECATLRQRAARLTRQTRRQVGAPRSSKQVRFAR